jgi:hypothetical protein
VPASKMWWLLFCDAAVERQYRSQFALEHRRGDIRNLVGTAPQSMRCAALIGFSVSLVHVIGASF